MKKHIKGRDDCYKILPDSCSEKTLFKKNLGIIKKF